MGILKMFKSWVIAATLFILGLLAAAFVGARRQATKDNLKEARESEREVSNVVSIASKARASVAKMPDSGPDSAIDQLRRDWEIPSN